MISEEHFFSILTVAEYAEQVETVESITGSQRTARLAAAKWDEMTQLLLNIREQPYMLLFLPEDVR